MPVLDMRDELSVFRGLENPNRWSGTFRGSPTRWKPNDGEAVIRAVRAVEADPVSRPLGRLRKAAPKPNEIMQTDKGFMVVPSNEEPEPEPEGDAGRAHTEIEYLLLRLGADMGFDVHVARNDQSSTWRGQSLGEVPRRRHALPQQFDPVTNQTIELIDVLWLDRNAIVAAFEIESTTSVYSGLLRMSDLLSRQPNISVPLFLVAPEERRSKVIQRSE